jgi:hypothetical protein
MVLAFVSASAVAQKQLPVCMMAGGLVDAVGMHLLEWDNQIDIGLNSSLNCSEFLEFVYLSRDRIRLQMDYVRGNFSAEDEAFRAQGKSGGSTTWAMTHMSTAASLVSAHMHIHGVLGAARRECLSEHLQLLFLMSFKRLKTLLHSQLRQLWVIFQGTAELFRQGAAKWLDEVLELLEADLRTMESIMVSWMPPAHELEPNADSGALAAAEVADNNASGQGTSTRPGPPLPAYSIREFDGALSTVEVLRRDTFEEWQLKKPLLQALLRHALPRGSHIADLCAGSGQTASFLNDTGLVVAHAFDSSPNIRLLSKGAVEFSRVQAEHLALWRRFELVLCLSAADDFGTSPKTWAQVWQNIEANAMHGAILGCGDDEARQQAMKAAAQNAPDWLFDSDLSERLNSDAARRAADSTAELSKGQRLGVCVFSRRATA